jgi:hypothetical protein
MIAIRSGKMPTTSVRRRISRFSRSFNRPRPSGSSGLRGASVSVDASEVGLEAFDELFVTVGFAGPAAQVGVVAQSLDVGELILECGCELGCGHVVVAVFADVGVGAGFGGEVSAAVAVGHSGFQHLAA